MKRTTKTPVAKTLKIIFQDDALVAIDKPAGLMVHRSRIDIRATEFALQLLRDQIGQPVFPVHRIDRPTSGVLLFALSPPIARKMCEQFESRSSCKEYEAIVRGHPPTAGRWDEPLLERRDETTDRLADRDKRAQRAVTEFETIQSWIVPYSTGKYPHSRYSHVRIRPLTGRRHQIRRHFNHMAYPVIGDTTHGDRRHNRLFREQFGIQRLLLVARRLTIEHPLTGVALTITAGLGRDFEAVISRLDTESDVMKSQ
jgi:tRNA pseudouridine65 synthase